MTAGVVFFLFLDGLLLIHVYAWLLLQVGLLRLLDHLENLDRLYQLLNLIAADSSPKLLTLLFPGHVAVTFLLEMELIDDLDRVVDEKVQQADVLRLAYLIHRLRTRQEFVVRQILHLHRCNCFHALRLLDLVGHTDQVVSHLHWFAALREIGQRL